MLQLEYQRDFDQQRQFLNPPYTQAQKEQDDLLNRLMYGSTGGRPH